MSGEDAMLAEIVARFHERDAQHRWEYAIAGAAVGACVTAFTLGWNSGALSCLLVRTTKAFYTISSHSVWVDNTRDTQARLPD